ncbi:MAG TPA: DUF4900 domain-containing protein [Oceanithermus profundus]|uniref:DUF4900 domain-containing protein n=1 Tax=Oceanithermus profundus TaxID=187137 RepID=A0A7C4ZEZ4_9DEIN|nr:DUF4900 domain-containing protein [Oceanithermus profundus]
MLYDGSVRLVWRAMPTLARGALVKGGAELALRKLQQELAGTLHVDLIPPSFARYMMFTNYQRAGAGAGAERVYFFGGTLFDGPVHTNDKFNFIGNPWFGDEVTSVGCERDDREHTRCLEKNPGYYYWDNATRTHVKVTPPVDPIPPAWAQPEFTVPPVWDKKYIALPEAGDDQYQAARDGGLFIEDPDENAWDTNTRDGLGETNIEAVTLSVATVGGRKYQFVQVHGVRNVGVETVPGRCVDEPPPGDGGGDDDDDEPPPPPPDDGPAVRWLFPGVRALAGALLETPALGAWSLPLRWLRPGVAGVARVQSNPCLPGQRWIPPRKRANVERFWYAYRIDETGRVERNDGSGWTFFRDHFNGVIYVGREGEDPGDKPKTGSFTLQGAGLSEPADVEKFWNVNWPRFGVGSAADCPYTATQEDGDHACIEPSIADFMQLTVVGNNININRDITYEDRPCTRAPERQPDGSVTPGECPNLDAENVLGVYSDTGSIMISKWAPENLHIDGILMSAKQRIYYQNWDKGDPKGYLHLTGGIIQNWYGRFGRLDGDLNIESGYGRKFVYDRRMKEGLSPPYFPKFEGDLPWKGKAVYLPPAGGGGSGFWKPVEGK